jgi:hypothetical protein
MKLDIEGLEEVVLAKFFSQGGCRPEFILLEDLASRPRYGEVRKLLKNQKYEAVWSQSDNYLFRDTTVTF